MMKTTLICCALCYFVFVADLVHGQDQPVRVFILAGQSNMEGKGSVETLNRQLKDDEKAKVYNGLTRDGKLFPRDDVFISYLGHHGIRSGELEVGYGTSRKDDKRLFGPELGFGWKIGDHFDEKVLIIKTAWGGKSIDRDFRPPSRKYPDSLEHYFEQKKKKNADITLQECRQDYGHFFRKMIEHVKSALDDPSIAGPNQAPLKLAGFVWFQGFNDQFAPTSVEDYEENMVAFIKDVRHELNAPDLPFVIGAMGHQGKDQKGKVKEIADAQVAAAKHFSDGSVVTVKTAELWDVEAHEAYKKYWADEPNRDPEKWRNYGNDHPYHYLGSPKFFWRAGTAFGDAMIELTDTDQK